MQKGPSTAGAQEDQARSVTPLEGLSLCSRCELRSPWAFSACCSLFGASSRHLFSLTLTHMGSAGRAPRAQCLGWLSGTPAHRAFSPTSLSLTPCGEPWAPGRKARGHPGSAPRYSPETAGVGLAQDTVVRRGQGVKPEVSKALVGVGLGGGGALKSVVTGRREKRTSGDSVGQGPLAEDAEADPQGPVPEGRQD